MNRWKKKNIETNFPFPFKLFHSLSNEMRKEQFEWETRMYSAQKVFARYNENKSVLDWVLQREQ